ncbi:MAG: hypothetical protein ABEJ60_02355 [Halodesulfurarchaeum sp.]
MTTSDRWHTGWIPFLVVAALGVIGIYLVSISALDTLPRTTAMAAIAIVVVAAYERFIGWG